MRLKNVEVKVGEVVLCNIDDDNDNVIIGYVIAEFDDKVIIYAQNRLVLITITTDYTCDVETGDWICNYYQNSKVICDYCIIPEADMIMKMV